MSRGLHSGTKTSHAGSTYNAHRESSGRFHNRNLSSPKLQGLLRPSKRTFITRRTRRRFSIFLVFILVVSTLLGPFSYGAGRQQGVFSPNTVSVADAAALAVDTVEPTPLPPAPAGTPVPVVPTPDPGASYPYLDVDTKVAPDTLEVGDTFTVTIAVHNQSPNEAKGLSISLPLPAGVERATGSSAGGSSSSNGSGSYSWQEASLGANSDYKVTAVLRLTAPQPGDAIVLKPQVSASNLPTDIVDTAGAIVVQANEGPTIARYNPGSVTTLRSADNRVTVTLPLNASASALTLSHDKKPKSGSKDEEKAAKKAKHAGKKNGLPAFYLNATDDTGNEVHQFSAPLTITITYTPQQLEALGIAEGDLTLFWFDADNKDTKKADGTPEGKWVPIDTDVDPRAHTATAQVDHFSNFKLSDGSSPSEAYIPSLQGWQVSLFTGAASYQYPIQVPAGPGGMKPSVSLSYSSGSTDGGGGERERQQAGWVGKGWSLDTGSIALNRAVSDQTASRYYTLVLNGQSYDLVRGSPRPGFRGTIYNGVTYNEPPPSVARPNQWEWKSTDESFIRVRAETNGLSTATRGGYSGATALPRYRWQVWTPDGTRYDFEEDAWQGFVTQDANGCAPGQSFMEAYKWHLTSVEDTHGNRISYGYDRESGLRVGACDGVQGTIDWAVWPTEITWGQNVNVSGSTDRYRVGFVSSARTLDTQWDAASNQLGPAPQEKRRLDVVKVQSKQATAWELVREYRLCYAGMGAPCPSASNLLSDDSVGDGSGPYTANAGYPKITLTGIQQVGNDGETVNPPTALPLTTFTYGSNNNDRGTGYYPRGDWNRLTGVNNGQGGTTTFNYENIGAITDIGIFRNYRRVTSRVVGDGRGNSYTWTYTYTSPAFNSLGTILNDGHGPQQNPNSATVYFSYYYPAAATQELIHKAKSEFRGHGKVVERDPNNNETEHFFQQGEAGCVPDITRTGEDIYNPDPNSQTSCFLELRESEFLKGREYQTITYKGTVSPANKLSEVVHTFSVNFLSDGRDPWVSTTSDDRYTGLWRAYVNESETLQKTWEGTTTPISKRTTYQYDGNTGNLLSTTEYSATGAAYRTTLHSYKTLDTNTNYILDRKRKDTVRQGDANGPLLAHTIYGYDGYLGGGEALIKGDLTLVRKYYNLTVPPSASFPGTGNSTDTSYTYDVWGNPKTVTTYDGAGVTLNFNTTAPSYQAAGGGTAGNTTTTDYDTTFNALPVKITNPTVNGVTLVEQAGYDTSYGMRMGLMTSVTDANNYITYASYDEFGRLVGIVKPGDNWTYPTFQAAYVNYDGAAGQPFIYETKQRFSTASTWSLKLARQFYDGMGRKIQTRTSSNGGATQSIVADIQYNGLGQAIKQSQPRYQSGFWTYTPPSTDPYILWTTSEYDALGRATKVTTPDGNFTSMSYKLNGNWLETVTTDANGHKKAHASDVFGRLSQVRDYTGTTNANYALYSTTNYAYSPLDLLTTVTDANNVTTSISYDSLGRKTSITDPTMGTWSYEYYSDGNLKKQTDAKSQTVIFEYDALDRLRYKRFSDNTTSEYIYDQSFAGDGLGQRTTIQRLVGTSPQSITNFWYDNRGRQTRATTYAGLPNGGRTFQWSYDSGDRVTSMTYPTGELVYYKYDWIWRQTSVCTDTGETNCYARNAQYTALDQPQSFTLGNGLSQNYTYESVMKRLQSLQVGTGGSVLNKSYTYDDVGNVQTMNDAGGAHTFFYDHLDRLTMWTWPGSDENYSYNVMGNLISKGTNAAPVTYNYGTGNGGPYALRNLNGGAAFQYDANGNMTSSPATPWGDPARTLSWNVENLPTSITSVGANGVTESYVYDADDERIQRTVSQFGQSTTTYYIGGLYEQEEPAGTMRTSYTLNGQVVAQKETASKGLRGEYYATTGLTPADLKLVRIDQDVNFDWGTGSPAPSGAMPSDNFSVRWTGKVQATTTGTYNFYTLSDDGVKLWVNGVLLINNWTTHAPTENVGAITLTAGQQYDIKLEYFEGGAGAVMKLSWLPPGGTKQIIPTSQLIPPTPTSTVTYLHGDHLGSVSVATDSTGAVVSRQEYDPWGKVRSGGVGHTDLNYTGQRKDDTGLLYYHARYYDPSVARFVSPDSIVPGASSGVGGAGGTVGAGQDSILTTDFHETRLLALSTGTSSRGWAPSNPQALNRFAYVLNNPLRYIDPTGHDVDGSPGEKSQIPEGDDPNNLYHYFPKRYQHSGGSNEVGEELNWPKGAGDEAQRMRDLNDSDLDGIEGKGWTPEDIDRVAEGYEKLVSKGGGNNKTAAARARYLREVAKRLRARAAEREKQQDSSYGTAVGVGVGVGIATASAYAAYSSGYDNARGYNNGYSGGYGYGGGSVGGGTSSPVGQKTR